MRNTNLKPNENNQVFSNFEDDYWKEFERLSDSKQLKSLNDCKKIELLPTALFRVADITPWVVNLNEQRPFVLVNAFAWDKAVKSCYEMWLKLMGKDIGQIHGRLFIAYRIKELLAVSPTLKLILAMTEYKQFPDSVESILDIALAEKTGTRFLLNELWFGPNALVQKDLFRIHDDSERWPNSDLFKDTLSDFYARLSFNQRRAINPFLIRPENGLFWHLHDDHKYFVSNMPVLCGLMVMTHYQSDGWWNCNTKINIVKELIFFDEYWFDIAFNQGVKLAISLELHKQSEGD